MKTLLLLGSLFLAFPVLAQRTGGAAAHRNSRALSLRLPTGLGRCSGNAYCRSCSNCQYCGHCAGGGGTCGVCAPSASPARLTPVRASRSVTTTRRRNSLYASSRSGRTRLAAPSELSVTGDYYVGVATLNLRDAPITEAKILQVLDRNDVVTVQEITNAEWVRVSVTTQERSARQGYVARAYLSETVSY